jgi:nucleoside diphosphate kinase
MPLNREVFVAAAFAVGFGVLVALKNSRKRDVTPAATAGGASASDRGADDLALVFIKPHGQTESMAAFIEKELRAAGLTIVQTGQLPGKFIDENGIIDSHYAAIGQYAMKTPPADLPLGDDKKQEFEAKYGDNFASAAASGKLINTGTAMKRFGLSGTEIGAEFEKAASTRMKLAPGCYVAFLKDRDVYVVNGFYGSMRAEYVDPRAVVTWYTVSWSEDRLSWADFRANVLGATEPTVAKKSSIRAKILGSYLDMKLPFVPSSGKNCMHGSASPLEAMNERRIWTFAKIEADPFGAQLLAAGVSKAKVEWFCTNPSIAGKPLFDLVEDTNTSDCLKELVKLSK